MDDDRIRIPRRVWVPAAVFALALIGLLAAQLAVISTQKKTNDRQLAEQARLVNPSLPLIREARSTLRGTRAAKPVETARLARELAAETVPVMRSLRQGHTAQAVAEIAILARRLAETGAVERAANAAERGARAAERGATAAERGADEAASTRRLAAELLALQRQALGVLRQSLEIQRQTLAHAESIDRKTGPPPPSAPAVP